MFTFIAIHTVYFRFCMFAVYHLHMQPLRHVSDLRVLCLYHYIIISKATLHCRLRVHQTMCHGSGQRVDDKSNETDQ